MTDGPMSLSLLLPRGVAEEDSRSSDEYLLHGCVRFDLCPKVIRSTVLIMKEIE